MTEISDGAWYLFVICNLLFGFCFFECVVNGRFIKSDNNGVVDINNRDGELASFIKYPLRRGLIFGQISFFVLDVFAFEIVFYGVAKRARWCGVYGYHY